jgi:class 3 adenylate cyclase
MTVQVDRGRGTGGSVRALVWAFHLLFPLLGLWLLLVRPDLDLRWQHHPSHFWLVMGVAAVSVWLGLRMQSQARSRTDARLLLVGFAFTTSAGFLFLHALATPGILVAGSNLGFQVATPVGLAVASLLLAVSAFDLPDRLAGILAGNERRLRAAILGVMVLWAAASIGSFGPLDSVPSGDEARGVLEIVAGVSVALCAIASVGYFRIHRRRPSVMLIGLITAAALLGEAMFTVVFARNWQLSWWLWHLLMAGAFGFFSYSAYVQYRREGSAAGLFNAITTEQTVARLRTEYGSALEALTSALRRSAQGDVTRDELELITRGLAARFGMTEGQTEVLHRAAEALAAEQTQAVRLGALAEIGVVGRVRQGEAELLRRLVQVVEHGFAGDAVRFGLVKDGALGFPAEFSAGVWGTGPSLAVPLTIGGAEVGVVEVQRRGQELAARDRAVVETLAAEVSIALENVRLYGQVEGLFRRYMSPAVATALLADPDQARLGGAVVEVTSLFADLRGFTTFSERSSPEQIVDVLNLYFGLVVPRVLEHGGTLVQFVGDALLAVFNTPARQADHALKACRAAMAMQEAVGAVVAEHPSWPLFRVGINTGPALAGNIGSDEVRSFNVMGDAVNVAARLESVAVPGTVVIGDTTYRAIAGVAEVEPLGELELKGKERPVAAFRLVRLNG